MEASHEGQRAGPLFMARGRRSVLSSHLSSVTRSCCPRELPLNMATRTPGLLPLSRSTEHFMTKRPIIAC